MYNGVGGETTHHLHADQSGPKLSLLKLLNTVLFQIINIGNITILIIILKTIMLIQFTNYSKVIIGTLS